MKPDGAKPLRCAIYTRVSTEYGLEQEFNSLDAQREAAEAYIKSQAHEGWRCLPTQYDDGGFSGGSMGRPALQQLLSDIRNRTVDVVVVYKVDRLTRSLADFAKLVELFDAQNVSFVSVTQAFNTTTSMGRLTLNVLLSFAQFEREVTGERIRDKIAASKRKGMRMGGPVPLGYDVEKKRLVVNSEEADRVRLIFQRYLDLGCLTKLACDLRERGIWTKRTSKSNGSARGGIAFTKGPLAHLLKNRVYIGDIIHKDEHFAGEHAAIVEQPLFDAVQSRLASHATSRGAARLLNPALLVGRIFDDKGNRMTPSTTKKGAGRYRYYVSAVLSQGRKEDAGTVSRVSAPEIEALVLKAIKQHSNAANDDVADRVLVERHVEAIVVKKGTIDIKLRQDQESEPISVSLPWAPTPTTRKRDIIVPATSANQNSRPIRSESRARLVEGIAKARLWLDELVSGTVTSTKQIAAREKCSERSIRTTLSLAFLNPGIVKLRLMESCRMVVGFRS